MHAVDADTAYLMSAGPGEASRIYKTDDGGASWTAQFVNDVPEAFFDCMDFWDPLSGLAYSDSVGGEMVLIRTRDGATWERIDAASLPHPLPGEGGFAASGTCAAVLGEQTAFIAMGVGGARVLKTTDRGDSWEVITTPVPHGNETSGLTSVTFLANGTGIAAGGDISAPDDYDDNVAMSEDFGESWWLVAGPTFPGAVYGVAYVPGAPTFTSSRSAPAASATRPTMAAVGRRLRTRATGVSPSRTRASASSSGPMGASRVSISSSERAHCISTRGLPS